MFKTPWLKVERKKGLKKLAGSASAALDRIVW